LCLAQDDVKRFISEPQPPPSRIEVPMEGKAKERREVGEGDDTVVVEDTSDDDDEDEETLQTASSCGRGLAARACLMFRWYKTLRLAWRLALLRRHGSRATPPGSG
jgi:hypothetical protein